MKLQCQKDLFSLSDEEIYLNGAYMSPLLKSAEKAGVNALRLKLRPIDINMDHFFALPKELRSLFAKFINTRDLDRIAIIPSVSYGIATVAKNIDLKKGERILLVGDQFPSNYYSWKRLADENEGNVEVVRAPQSLDRRGEQWNQLILESIQDGIKVVSMCHVHWADGTLFDLLAIREACDKVGAYLIIDGTQSLGALPFDQSIIKADALIAASYKWMCGPYSLGVAYYGERFDNGVPVEESWINRRDSDNFKDLVNYQENYREKAQRYSMGEFPNFALLPVMMEGIRQLIEWQPIRFQAYCKELVNHISEQLRSDGYWIENERYRASHLFGIAMPEGTNVNEIKEKLVQEKISVSYRGNFIRVSPAVYNSKLEMQKFANCLSNRI